MSERSRVAFVPGLNDKHVLRAVFLIIGTLAGVAASELVLTLVATTHTLSKLQHGYQRTFLLIPPLALKPTTLVWAVITHPRR
jgi:hypothetical protein